MRGEISNRLNAKRFYSLSSFQKVGQATSNRSKMSAIGIGLLFLAVEINGRCITARNPWFTEKLQVEMLTMETARVSWEGITQNLDCVDQFAIKFRREKNQLLENEQWTLDEFRWKVTPWMNSSTFVTEIKGEVNAFHFKEDIF